MRRKVSVSPTASRIASRTRSQTWRAARLWHLLGLLSLLSLLAQRPPAAGAHRPSGAPATPTITEPLLEGKVVNPGDVHMETAPFDDPTPGAIHHCTDWEIWSSAPLERVWALPCGGGLDRLHTHLGDGSYQGSYAGLTTLRPATSYQLRVRHAAQHPDLALAWSAWATRGFTTAAPSIGDPNQKWSVRQPGYDLEVVASGLRLPVNIAFKPGAGEAPGDPYYYISELYGAIKVVTRSGAVQVYATGLLNYNPNGKFPGSGEQGLTGLLVEPASGDVIASTLYRAANGATYPKVLRFTSADGGLSASGVSTILDMPGEPQGQSHQISNLSWGPDGTLYVHNGDGFDFTTAQNRDSFRGKILRMNLDGSPAADNPFYDAADGISARDYIYAYGFRNPFGGAWRQADGALYAVENGPHRDRLVRIVPGRNYLWDGSNASMESFAIRAWDATAPVNLAFVQETTYAGSGFPPEKYDHLFMSESSCAFCAGPAEKTLSEYVLAPDGTLLSGPRLLVAYTGVGRATIAGLAAGPDGLYFTDLYRDDATIATERGANVYRLRYVGTVDFAASPRSAASPPLTVQFTDLSSVPGATGWLWDFGDGTTSAEQHPVHTYAAYGSYPVQLLVSGATGTRAGRKIAYVNIENYCPVTPQPVMTSGGCGGAFLPLIEG